MSRCILKNVGTGEARLLPDIIISSADKRKVCENLFCFDLICAKNIFNYLLFIYLLFKIVGRNVESGIQTPIVSREHLLCKPKFDEKVLLIRHLGKSPAGN